MVLVVFSWGAILKIGKLIEVIILNGVLLNKLSCWEAAHKRGALRLAPKLIMRHVLAHMHTIEGEL